MCFDEEGGGDLWEVSEQSLMFLCTENDTDLVLPDREKLLRLGVDEEDIDYEGSERPTGSRRKRMRLDAETPQVDGVAGSVNLG